MEFLITWSIALGFLVVPGLINYYATRYFTPPGATLPPRLELLTASFVLTFVILVVDIFVVLLVSLAWDGLRSETADFVTMGLEGYGEHRPIAITGVLTAASFACMGVMAALGVLRVPARWLR